MVSECDMPIIGAARLGQWQPLIELLRSGEELSYEVRLILAEILEGNLPRLSNQPPKYLGDKLKPAARVIQKQRDPVWAGKQEAVVQFVADEMGVSVRTVKESLKQYRELDEMIRSMQSEADDVGLHPHKRLHIGFWAGVYRRFLASMTG